MSEYGEQELDDSASAVGTGVAQKGLHDGWSDDGWSSDRWSATDYPATDDPYKNLFSPLTSFIPDVIIYETCIHC